MFSVTEKKNICLEKCISAKKAGRKLYIYGCGCMGKKYLSILRLYNIEPDGFCVDSKYYKEDCIIDDLPLIQIDDLFLGGGIIVPLL